MENMTMPRLLKLFISTLLLATFLTGCDKDDDEMLDENKDVVQLSGNASGSQEVPAVQTAATGTLSGSYNKSSNTLQYTISWNGLVGGNVVGMHFHGPADPGINASVVVPVSGFATTASGTVTNSATLTDAQEADLLAGKWYYNIHTDTYKGGEIRGQVVVK
jgi:hypothetical protein